MMVMVSNQTGFEAGMLFGQYLGAGLLGHLYSPGGQRGPWPGVPFSLDTGDFADWAAGKEWNEADWRAHLAWARASGYSPLWAVVHDAVADRERTLERWEVFAPVVREHGFRPAFAVQDGMTFEDVPDSECVLFIGGSTSWKLAAIKPWCSRFPGRVHVARVNTWDRLMLCYEAGAVSVDGTGWFRKTNKPGQRVQNDDLRRFLAMVSKERMAA